MIMPVAAEMRKIVLGHLGAFVPVKGALKLSAKGSSMVLQSEFCRFGTED
jgi:hypothetical protein